MRGFDGRRALAVSFVRFITDISARKRNISKEDGQDTMYILTL